MPYIRASAKLADAIAKTFKGTDQTLTVVRDFCDLSVASEMTAVQLDKLTDMVLLRLPVDVTPAPVEHFHIVIGGDKGEPWCHWTGTMVGRDISAATGVSTCSYHSKAEADAAVAKLIHRLPNAHVVAGECPTMADMLEKNQAQADAPYLCKGCGRPEDACSANPCDDVIADRGEDTPDPMGGEVCDQCNAELDSGQIGLCDDCQNGGDEALTCPACGDNETIDIAATVFVRVTNTSDGPETDADEARDQSHEWDDAAPCVCRACDRTGTVGEFRGRQAPQTPATPPALAGSGLTDRELLQVIREEVWKNGTTDSCSLGLATLNLVIARTHPPIDDETPAPQTPPPVTEPMSDFEDEVLFRMVEQYGEAAMLQAVREAAVRLAETATE